MKNSKFNLFSWLEEITINKRDWSEFNEDQIGMQWEGNPIPLRLMPDRYKKEAPEAGFWRSMGHKIFGNKIVAPSYHPWFIGTLKSVMRIAIWFFSRKTDYFSKKLAYYEKAYPNEQLDNQKVLSLQTPLA